MFQIRTALLSGAIAALATLPAAAAGLDVVAAENFYGDLAKQVGGKAVTVTSILSNPDQDPHLFEADPSTARALKAAKVVVSNGIDYDPWMEKLTAADPSPGRAEIVAADLMGKKTGDNPHLWYDPKTMETVAAAMAEKFGAADPSDKAAYKKNADAFDASLEAARRQDRIHEGEIRRPARHGLGARLRLHGGSHRPRRPQPEFRLVGDEQHGAIGVRCRGLRGRSQEPQGQGDDLQRPGGRSVREAPRRDREGVQDPDRGSQRDGARRQDLPGLDGGGSSTRSTRRSPARPLEPRRLRRRLAGARREDGSVSGGFLDRARRVRRPARSERSRQDDVDARDPRTRPPATGNGVGPRAAGRSGPRSHRLHAAAPRTDRHAMDRLGPRRGGGGWPPMGIAAARSRGPRRGALGPRHGGRHRPRATPAGGALGRRATASAPVAGAARPPQAAAARRTADQPRSRPSARHGRTRVAAATGPRDRRAVQRPRAQSAGWAPWIAFSTSAAAAPCWARSTT